MVREDWDKLMTLGLLEDSWKATPVADFAGNPVASWSSITSIPPLPATTDAGTGNTTRVEARPLGVAVLTVSKPGSRLGEVAVISVYPGMLEVVRDAIT